MLRSWLKSNYHFLALVVFFCFHGFNEYYGLIELTDFFLFASTLFITSYFLFWFFNLFYKNKLKAGLLTTATLFIFLFFGVMQDALVFYKRFAFLSGPVYFIPLMIGLFVVFLFVIWKIKKWQRLILYVHLLLLILIIFETGNLLYYLFANKTKTTNEDVVCNNCLKPPVYVLVLDEYAGDTTLSGTYHFDNNAFKSTLTNQGFFDVKASQSNYVLTVHSVASFLNMDYLPIEISSSGSESAYGYKTALAMIKENLVTKKFQELGYEIKNYSPFDFKNAPATISNEFWGGNIRLITSQMMHRRLLKQLPFFAARNKFIKLPKLLTNRYYTHIEFALSGSVGYAQKNAAKPVFTYIHLNLPHSPILFDSLGNRFNRSVIKKWTPALLDQAYLWNLKKANEFTLKWVGDIKKAHSGNVVILIMSDHGPSPTGEQKRRTDNLNIVYLPNGNYANWYSGFSNVNQFRVLFNIMFQKSWPLLKDTAYNVKKDLLVD